MQSRRFGLVPLGQLIRSIHRPPIARCLPDQLSISAYLAGTIPAPISDVKTKELEDGSVAVAFNALADSKGDLYNQVTAPKPLSSAREYETPLTRWWDTFWKAERSSLWYTKLDQVAGSRYKLSAHRPINALNETLLEHPMAPSDPLGGLGYDISRTGLLLKARDPDYNPGITTRLSIFYVRLSTFTESPSPKICKIAVPDYEGLASHPVFSPDGNSAAFLHTKQADSMYDWNRIFVVRRLNRNDAAIECALLEPKVNEKHWGLSPDTITWANNGEEIYVTAAEGGYQKLFTLPLGSPTREPLSTVPTPISQSGAVSAIYPLGTTTSDKRLFVNKTSLIDSSIFMIIDAESAKSEIVSSASEHGSAFGLRSAQISEIMFKGEDGVKIQAWVVKPSFFDQNKTYPLLLFIHGGPVSVWPDAWSTRWNPAVFAEQGYVVVAPNISGSTGFGQEFVDRVKDSWGGRPYVDLVKCFDYIEKNMPFVDTDRAVAAGGSYGGYMINWIAGQPLAKRLKALVCHDGIFSNYNLLSSDCLTILPSDMGGALWKNKAGWDKYDAAQHTQNWCTPMLIIHSDNDFRSPITEGLAAFAVCQQLGIESRFLNFPDENHWVLKRENSLHWYKTVLGWINKYAKVEGGVVLEPPASEPRPIWKGDQAK